MTPDPLPTCAYCMLPGHMMDPFSGRPCCRVDFELLAGALDFDEPPTADQLMETLLRPSFTTDEFRAWVLLLENRFGVKVEAQ